LEEEAVAIGKATASTSPGNSIFQIKIGAAIFKSVTTLPPIFTVAIHPYIKTWQLFPCICFIFCQR